MYCTSCGAFNGPEQSRCTHCGMALSAQNQAPTPQAQGKSNPHYGQGAQGPSSAHAHYGQSPQAAPQYGQSPQAAPQYGQSPQAAPQYGQSPQAAPQYGQSPQAAPQYGQSPQAVPNPQGQQFSQTTLFCSHCGTSNDRNNFRCIQCGAVMQTGRAYGAQGGYNPEKSKRQSKALVYIIVSVFFILLCTIPGIGAMIMSVMAYNSHDEEQAQKLLKYTTWVFIGSLVFGLFVGVLAAVAG